MGLPRCPNTGDPLPAEPVIDPECEDRAPGATRWLAMDPHTPFAITTHEYIETAGHPCCAVWAHLGDRYRAIDRWGQVTGRAEIDGGEGYDASACFELSLRITSGREGVGIYASDGGAFSPPSSAEWQPTPDQIAALRPFVEEVEGMVTDPDLELWENAPPVPPLADRTMYFQTMSESDDGRRERPDHYAVAGGRALIILWLSPSGRWVLTHVENDLTNLNYVPNDVYRPVAVFDMDGDGTPEVLYHWNEGPGWGQVVLQQETRLGRWRQAARSVGGSTA